MKTTVIALLGGMPFFGAVSDLLALPRVTQESDFRCGEGWQVKDLHWAGVRISHLLSAVAPPPPARYLTIHAGPYTAVLSLQEAGLPEVLLVTHLDGAPLSLEHGGPVRLVVPSEWDCFTSVKWVQRLEVTQERAEPTGPAIALARIGRQPAPSRPLPS
jgi:DMSO/TMAO reductase YedYZ molybdopterin-dependent catalytic subunit